MGSAEQGQPRSLEKSTDRSQWNWLHPSLGFPRTKPEKIIIFILEISSAHLGMVRRDGVKRGEVRGNLSKQSHFSRGAAEGAEQDRDQIEGRQSGRA